MADFAVILEETIATGEVELVEEDYLPAYYFGYSLANAENMQADDWASVEAGARLAWEELYPGSWPTMKAAVERAFLEIKEAIE